MSLNDVNEDSGHVEQSGKPGNNKNDMNSLEIEECHVVKMVRTPPLVNRRSEV